MKKIEAKKDEDLLNIRLLIILLALPQLPPITTKRVVLVPKTGENTKIHAKVVILACCGSVGVELLDDAWPGWLLCRHGVVAA